MSTAVESDRSPTATLSATNEHVGHPSPQRAGVRRHDNMRWMQAAGIDAFGGRVRMLELAAPASPAPDEVVISVQAAGVGNWDEFIRVDDWPRRKRRKPPTGEVVRMGRCPSQGARAL